MTTATTTSKAQFNGNGSTTAFPFSFKFTAAAEIEVILTSAAGVDTVKTITTHYTQTAPGVGGTVTMLTAPASGEVLTVRRIMPLTQAVDLTAGGGLTAEVIEAAFDKLTMISQQLLEKIRRAVKFRDGSTASEPTLPQPSANAVLAWNAAGTGLENRTLAADAALDPLGVFDIRDFGTVGDGVTNDTLAVSNAFNAGGAVFVPAGIYLIDPITISVPVHVMMHPEAVIKRRSGTAGADSYLISFAAGAAGSIIEGGITDGNRSALAASFGANPQALWPEIMMSGAERVTIRNMVCRNSVTLPIWGGNASGHIVENITVEDSGRVILFQFTEDSIVRNITGKDIGNNGVAQYQHACELRQLERCVIENIRLDGYAPDALGTDPWPTAFIFERIFGCKVSGLFLEGYAGSETRNYGALISNAKRSTFSAFDLRDVFWGVEWQTCLDCSLNGFSIHGFFKTHASSDGAGMQFFSGGVFQNSSDPNQDTRANSTSKQVTIANGSILGCEDGVLLCASNVHMVNVIANANRNYGFHTRELATNGFFAGHDKQRVENIQLDNCQARFNGFDGMLIEAGNQIAINGGLYCDNGWDTSLGATFRAGVAMIEDATAAGIDKVTVSNVFAGDTQTFTKTDGASFNPGATVANRFNISLIDPDQIAVGQFLSLINANGVGNVSARVVAFNLDEATVETSGAVTFSETGNLTSLTGTLSSSGNAVTGSGTAFTTEIKGGAWIKVGGSYYHVARVNSNTSMIVFPTPSPAWAGASGQILTIDVQGVPSQQHALVTDANVNGPVRLVNVEGDGAVTSLTSIANAGCLDIIGVDTVQATAGIYANQSRYAFGSTDLLQAVVHIAKPGADDNLLCLSGQSGGQGAFGQFSGTQFWQTVNVHLEIGTNTAAKTLAFRTAGTTRMLLTDSAFSPNANDGVALGTGALKWSDLHLASGGVINWNNGNMLVTHSPGKIQLTGGSAEFACSNATTFTDYIRALPTDFGVGKPYCSITKQAAATGWAISLWDGSSSTGNIDIGATSVRFPSITTTASAANAFLDSGNSNNLLRSTSSRRYKRDIEGLEADYADRILALRPVWYRSRAECDRADWSWYGLIAEEVAEVDPRLVHWTYPEEAFDLIEHKVADAVQRRKITTIDPQTGEEVDEIEEEVTPGGVQVERVLKEGAEKVPDGVQYDRLTVLLLDLVRRQEERIKALEARP